MKKTFLSLILVLSISNLNAQTKERDFQLSFMTPLGTNGINSQDYVNKFSLNLLGGYSSGNKIFELGGLYNVSIDFSKGLQVAGITNYSGEMGGVQVAGITNYSGEIDGAQVAGITNISKDVEGIQIGGLANIAGDIEGAQIAGLLNIADEVDGVQIGLFNYAKSVDEGLPIGLINVVKEGGKYEGEVSFSEALSTTLSFKLGTDYFYTIFSAGVNYIKKPVDYAVGLGFGTHIHWDKGWGNEIEAIGYALTEEGVFPDELNLLTQLKFPISKEFSKHFKIFAGPVLNLTISSNNNSPTIAPWTMWQTSLDENNLSSWLGFTAGVRF